MTARALGEVGQAQQGGRLLNHEFNAKVYGCGNTTTYTYDKLNRQIKVTAPFDDSQSSKTMTYYDNNGNVVKTKELVNVTGSVEEYRITEYEYDSRNRLVTAL